ncbi:MAG TPA: hypothetical protein VML50_07505 [Anaeromyxobacter sp.]|nr:hypothetical protein [Anaeromyxobacter sp.]
MRKLAAHLVAAATLAALAAPALPCEGMTKTTMAEATKPQKPAPVATAKSKAAVRTAKVDPKAAPKTASN